jgi:integrase
MKARKHKPVARRRVRIAPGIYEDQYGRFAIVTVRPERREQRFAPDDPIDFIQAWRARTESELREDALEHGKAAPVRGTYAADMARFVELIKGRVAFKADRSHLKAWLPFLGPKNRRTIDPDNDIQPAINAWQAKGVAARTIRHRVRVLRELYKRLDGPRARPPLAGLTRPKVPKAHPVPVSTVLVRKVAASLKKGKRHDEGYGSEATKTHARFLVRATTGQRPAQIMRALPIDVDFRRKVWYVRDAKGGRGIGFPLSAEQLVAWRVFAQADAWGDFDTTAFAKTIRRHGWTKGVRPYALRHTFAIDQLAHGTDIGDLQALLGHQQIETTRQFYAPVALPRLRKVKMRTLGIC